MTSKERVLTTLQLKEPDVVPTFEWIINPDIIEKMTGQRDEIQFVKMMGIDGIMVSEDFKKEIIDSTHYRDEWGIVRETVSEYPNPVVNPVKNEADLKNLTIPDPDAEYRYDGVKKALHEVGDEKAVIIKVRDVFSQPRDLMGFEEFLVSLYTQPDIAKRLIEISVDYNSRVAKNARELGGEVIVTGDDIAQNSGLLISPKMYREIFYPFYKELVHRFKEMGYYVIKHTDGDIMEVIDDIIDTGIDCIDPIDPLAGMDIELIKKEYGNRVCIKGNIDCVKTLVDKSTDEVVKEVKECILKASFGGGHIISSSNSIHSGINPVNYKTFLDAIKIYGQYPLDREKLIS